MLKEGHVILLCTFNSLVGGATAAIDSGSQLS
jgi:hypothetical protein